MKKLLVFLAAVILSLTLRARESCSDGYELSLDASYGYNTSWNHYGGASLSGYLPVHRYFEAEAYFQYMSAGDFTASVNARPKYALPVGELFLDAGLCCRMLHRYRTSDICAALSLGYRMDYINAQFGIFTRKMYDMDGGSPQVEAVNLLYRVAFDVRPPASVWNLGGGVTNFTEFEYERAWQPVFFIGGHYRINPRISARATVYIKPTGIFHLSAGFYGIRTSLGVTYLF